tara:strand:+ start:785 stop:1315 length:531 start_codon:yes stop_codon:yes gene_type:complete
MKRDYTSSDNVTGVTYFIGTEIEHTPTYGMKTLFVVGMQRLEEVQELAKTNKVEAIYLGANQSFDITGEHGTNEQQEGWDSLVKGLVKDYFVTLDFDLTCIEWIQESGYSEYNNFIPMVSVKVPYIELLGYNTCIKIDDIDFNATNKGVWTHSLHSLMNRNKFTSWNQYKQDEIIE